jgi:hypothetical protein
MPFAPSPSHHHKYMWYKIVNKPFPIMGGADGIALRTFFSYWISDEILLLFTTI